MAWIFSKRCKKALADRKIVVSIPTSTRVRIWKALQKHNELQHESDETGFNYQIRPLDYMPETFKAELGIKDLLCYTEKQGESPKPGDLENFVLRGKYPPHVLDILELFYTNISEKEKYLFQKDINQIMEEDSQPWRMTGGKIFPVDSNYIEEEILRKTEELLNDVKFPGALQELEKARTDLVNGDHLGAIQNANLAVESTLKGILGIDRAKPGELYRRVIDSGLVPEYYEGFLKSFEENILRSTAIMRNEERGAGHGQGIAVNEIPGDLAELGIHLSAVLIHYLIKRHLSKTASENELASSEEDIPF